MDSLRYINSMYRSILRPLASGGVWRRRAAQCHARQRTQHGCRPFSFPFLFFFIYFLFFNKRFYHESRSASNTFPFPVVVFSDFHSLIICSGLCFLFYLNFSYY